MLVFDGLASTQPLLVAIRYGQLAKTNVLASEQENVYILQNQNNNLTNSVCTSVATTRSLEAASYSLLLDTKLNKEYT